MSDTQHPAERILAVNAAITRATILASRGVIGETTPAEALDLAELLHNAEAVQIPPQDIERILRHVETVTPQHEPAALEDLDCAYRVGACMADSRRWFGGDVLGFYKGRAVLCWRKDGRLTANTTAGRIFDEMNSRSKSVS